MNPPVLGEWSIIKRERASTLWSEVQILPIRHAVHTVRAEQMHMLRTGDWGIADFDFNVE